MNYSQTQASNLVTLVGLIGFLLTYFHINITTEEVQAFLTALIALGGIVWNWYHRYQKGDLKLSGVRLSNSEPLA